MEISQWNRQLVPQHVALTLINQFSYFHRAAKLDGSKAVRGGIPLVFTHYGFTDEQVFPVSTLHNFCSMNRSLGNRPIIPLHRSLNMALLAFRLGALPERRTHL